MHNEVQEQNYSAYVIRQAASNEYPAIAEMQISVGVPISLQELVRQIHNGKRDLTYYVVAKFELSKEIELVGSFCTKVIDQSTVEVGSVTVKPNYRKQGIATKMLLFSEQKAKKFKYDVVSLTTMTENIPMQRCAEKCGWAPIDFDGIRYTYAKLVNPYFNRYKK